MDWLIIVDSSLTINLFITIQLLVVIITFNKVKTTNPSSLCAQNYETSTEVMDWALAHNFIVSLMCKHCQVLSFDKKKFRPQNSA
jgi:hypothetical protein